MVKTTTISKKNASMDTSTSEVISCCPNCGKMVPFANMKLHQVNSCGNDARHSSPHRHQERHREGSDSEEDLRRRRRRRMTDVSKKKYKQPKNNGNRIITNMTTMEQEEDDDYHHCDSDESMSSTSTIDLSHLPTPRSRTVEGRMDSGIPSAGISTSTTTMEGVTNTHPISPLVQYLGQVVNLVDNDDGDINGDAATSADENGGGGDDDDSIQENWSCPQCTLFNPLDKSCCEACGYSNTNGDNQIDGIIDMTSSSRTTTTNDTVDNFMVRNVSAGSDNDSGSITTNDAANTFNISNTTNASNLRRRRIRNNAATTTTTISSTTTIDAMDQPISEYGSDNNDSTRIISNSSNNRNGNSLRHMRTVGSGAFCGSIVGAARAYVQNRDPTSGAFNGAVVGAIGGAIYTTTHNSDTDSGISRAQTSASTVNSPPTSSTSSTSYSRGSREDRIDRNNSRAGFGVVTERFHTPMERSGGSIGGDRRRLIQRGDTGSVFASSIFETLLGSQNHGIAHNRIGDGDINGMSYERLLEVFGDGSENRGANQATINSLPTSTIRDVERELPIDCRNCSICLECISKGDVRKTLPCLHGFHQSCVDKWLATNGCCPICKHRI